MKENSKSVSGNYKVAFLRGINVGGNAVIKMADLKKEFISLGFKEVKTILASGNVIFKSDRKDASGIIKDIESKLKKMTGREVKVILRTVDELKELEASGIFDSVKVLPETRLLVTFLPENLASKNVSLTSGKVDCRILKSSKDTICYTLQIKPGAGTPEFMSILEKAYGREVTTRTWNTVIKILKAAVN